MPTYVTATRRGAVFSPYTCEHCGHQDQGMVFMRASASAQTGMLQGLDDTRDLAMGTATGNMDQAGDEIIALAPCPKCGQRDELAVRTFYAAAKPWLGGGAFFLVLSLAGVTFLASKGEQFLGMIVTAPLALIGLIALLVGVAKRLRKLPGGVVFHSVDPRPFQQPPGS